MNIHESMEASNWDDYEYAKKANNEFDQATCGHKACVESKSVALSAWEIPGGYEVTYNGEDIQEESREMIAHRVWEKITGENIFDLNDDIDKY